MSKKRIAELETERDAAIRLANLHRAMWREAEQDVVNLTEPLKYGDDMLCFTRGTFEEKVQEMEDMRARIAELEAEVARLTTALARSQENLAEEIDARRQDGVDAIRGRPAP